MPEAGDATPAADAPLRLELRSTVSEVVRARDEADVYLRATGADARARYAASLALEEMLTNVVQHGYAGRPDHGISVSVHRDGAGIRIVIEDEAPPFDPCGVPDPPRPCSIAEATIGGRGIAMVRHQARALSHAYVGGRNRVEIEIET